MSQALFLLFHEAGHYVQFQKYGRQGQERPFWESTHLVDGPEKADFEQDAWERSNKLLREFLHQADLPEDSVLPTYNSYAGQCIVSYEDGAIE